MEEIKKLQEINDIKVLEKTGDKEDMVEKKKIEVMRNMEDNWDMGGYRDF